MEKAKEKIKEEALMALAILAALGNEENEVPTIERVSEKLYELRQKGIEIGDVALRRIPGGHYSEDLENLIGHFLASGYAAERSPVKFTDSGIKLLREVVADEARVSPNVVRRAAQLLRVNL